MPYNNEQRKHCRVNGNVIRKLGSQISMRGGDELTPRFSSGPSIIDLCNSQNLTPRSKNAGVPDLVSEGQEVVVNPQPVHGNRKQLGGFVHELTFAPSPRGSWIRKTTLIDNLEESIRPGTLQVKTKRESTHSRFPISTTTASFVGSISIDSTFYSERGKPQWWCCGGRNGGNMCCLPPVCVDCSLETQRGKA